MPAFKDYAEFVEPLQLPYRGKVYEIPAVTAEDGLTLLRALDPETEDTLTRDEEHRILLGDVYAVMVADRVPEAFVTRCILTAIADFRNGRDAAEAIWETGADPKALERWVGTKLEEASPLSTRTGEATETPTPASTTGTTSRTPRRK